MGRSGLPGIGLLLLALGSIAGLELGGPEASVPARLAEAAQERPSPRALEGMAAANPRFPAVRTRVETSGTGSATAVRLAAAEAARPVSRSRPARAGVLGIALGNPAEVTSTAPAVDPGGIATVLVSVSLPPIAAGDTVAYELHLATGYRAYVPPTGVLTIEEDDGRVRIPVTFGVPPAEPAGLRHAGRIQVRTRSGLTMSDSLWIRVNPVYEVEAHLTAADSRVAPGRSVELRYRLRNRGNAVDSVKLRLRVSSSWAVRGLPPRVALEPGDTVAGTFELSAPENAMAGHEQSVSLEAEGYGNVDRSLGGILVAAPSPELLHDWAQIPGSVFVGSSLGAGGGTSVSLRADGRIGEGTELSVWLQRVEDGLRPPAFRDDLLGPRLRIELRRADLALVAGEVQTTGRVLSSPLLHGRGVEGRYRRGPWALDLYAAVPGGFGTSVQGHHVRSEARLDTDRGTFGLVAADIRESWPWGNGFRSTGIGLHWDLPRNGLHELSIQAGGLAVRPDSGESAFGPALDARYALTAEQGRLDLHGRLVPGTVPTNAAMASELFANGVLRLSPLVTVNGWGHFRSVPLLNTAEDPATTNLAFETRFQARDLQTEVGALHRRFDNRGSATRRTAATLGLSFPAGAIRLQADAQLGRYIRGTDSGPLGEVWGGARWYRDAGTWLRVGARYSRSEFADGDLFLDASGSVTRGRVSVEGGASGRVAGGFPGGRVSLWTSVDYEIRPELRLTAGADYRPAFGDDRLRFSIGVSRSMALPLPIPHTAALHGTAFEDLNGNRLRDTGEPVVSGLRLRVGRLETRTDGEGEFSFRDTYGGSLTVDPASLPLGLALLPDVYLPATGEVLIPLVRAGVVDVTLFIDRDGDRERDPAEELAQGVIVSLVDAHGVARDIEADPRGRVRFGAVPPGSYRLRVFRSASPDGGAAPVEVEITLGPGEHLQRTIPVPARSRTIRMGTGAGMGISPEQ